MFCNRLFRDWNVCLGFLKKIYQSKKNRSVLFFGRKDSNIAEENSHSQHISKSFSFEREVVSAKNKPGSPQFANRKATGRQPESWHKINLNV